MIFIGGPLDGTEDDRVKVSLENPFVILEIGLHSGERPGIYVCYQLIDGKMHYKSTKTREWLENVSK